MLPAKDVDVPTKRDAKSGGNKGSSHGSNANGGGNAADGGGGSNTEQVEAQGIPYMCLAQCEDMETTVGHRKVPPLKVCRLRNTKPKIQIPSTSSCSSNCECGACRAPAYSDTVLLYYIYEYSSITTVQYSIIAVSDIIL